MNIYYVNKQSKIKGPFDITDAHRQKIIKIGDVIIRNLDSSILFLLVVCNTNKWSSCQCVGKAEGSLDIDGNGLLFSFDGISRRFGNIQIIALLLEKFDTSPISDFLKNILSILEYKCDFIDAAIFYKIHSIKPIELSKSSNNLMKEIQVSNSATYLFEAYLNQDILIQFHLLLEKNMTLKNIYKEIRELYPNEFRKAIKAFLYDFPNSTIYDKV